MATFRFIGPTYQGRSLTIDSERTINLYPEIVDGNNTGKNSIVLLKTPGLVTEYDFIGFGASRVAGMFSLNGQSWAVMQMGPNCGLFELFDGGTVRGISAIISAPPVNAQVQFAANNNNQILILSQPNGYIYNTQTGVLTQITADGWLGGSSVAFLDGYFVVSKPNSNVFFWSAINDGLQWDPLDFEAVTGGPDNLVRIAADHRELWMFCEEHTEIYYDSGDADNPFQRIAGAYIQQGCAAQGSVVELDNTLFWIGNNGDGSSVLWRANGYIPQRVSTHGVEFAWQQYSTVADAVAYAYQDAGHLFYVVSFPTADATWAYDVSTQMWHERGSWNSGTGKYSASKARTHCFSFDRHFVGDYQSPKIYGMSTKFYTDAGDSIRWLRAAPHITNEMKRTFYSQFILDIQVGIGDTTVIDPQVILQWSDDGGNTWGNELQASAGPAGAFKTLVSWRRLGYARDRVFRVIGSDAVPIVIANAYLETQAGTS